MLPNREWVVVNGKTLPTKTKAERQAAKYAVADHFYDQIGAIRREYDAGMLAIKISEEANPDVEEPTEIPQAK